MLKDYVAKGLQFLQGKSLKPAAKQEEDEKPLQHAEASGVFEPASGEPVLEEPAETAEAPESDWDGDWGGPFAEPVPPERTPGQDD